MTGDIYSDTFAQQYKTMTGQELKELRLKAGLTQTELGQKIGVAYTKISQWENGKHKISKAYLRYLKVEFGLD